MWKKFFKHKQSSRLLAWVLAGVMTFTSAGVMPVTAAGTSGGNGAAAVSGGDVSGGDVSGGNGAGEVVSETQTDSATGVVRTINGNTTTWDFTKTKSSGNAKGETLGIVIGSGTVKWKECLDLFGEQDGKSNGTSSVTIPLKSTTASVKVTITLTGTGSNDATYGTRRVTLGNAANSITVYHKAKDENNVSQPDNFATNKTWSGTLDYTYFTNGNLVLTGNVGENKIGSIEIVETAGTVNPAPTPTESLKEMTVTTAAETCHFKNTGAIFGESAGDIISDTVFSANKYIKMTKDTADTWDATTNGHGLTFTKDIVIEVLVPANTMGVFKVIGCQYASCSGVMTAGGSTGESVSLKQGEDSEIPFTFENETDAAVTMKITITPSSRGYIHGVSYEVQELPAKSWQAQKAGTVTIGDTTFTVKAGGAEGNDFTVTAVSGSGRVEITGSEKTVVWADLGGRKLANAITAGEGVSGVSANGKTVTITYSDDTTLPETFKLEVRELGKTVTPQQDGKTNTYNLADGSIVSDLYTGKIAKDTVLSSEDGLFAVRSAGNVYYHGTQYGAVMNADDSFAVKVAGNAKVVIYGASFKTTGITATADKGVVYVAEDEEKAQNSADTSNQEPYTATFLYEGEATTLYFTFTGGTSYVNKVTVKNELPPVPEGATHPELGYTMPSVINWEKGKLETRVVGQTITLSNPTGLVKENIKTSGLGIFVFPATGDKNTLSVDLIVGDCAASTSNVAYVGLFNESEEGDNGIRAITTAIRSNNYEVVQLMSKKDSEVLGKNSFNGPKMEAGDVVRITISRDGSNIIQTFTNLTQGTDTVEKKTAYGSTKSFLNPGGDVWYGLMVSNRDVVVKNMVYTAEDGTVLYDQNKYYDPVGEVPVVGAVTAVAAEDRTKITVTWTADDAVYDAKYVLQVKKPGASDWEDVAAELTEKSYEYLVSSDESGVYTFRVCGTKGNAPEQNLANRNTYAESNPAEIEAALQAPVLTLPYVSEGDKVVLSWTASAGAESYEVYRSHDGKPAEKIATVTETSYIDTTVELDVPYYYSVKAVSANNFSPLSEEAWTLHTGQHSGEYDENVALYVTNRSYNTVFENKITMEGIVGAAGTVTIYVDGVEKASQAVASANGTFSFADVTIESGRNEVELVLEYGNYERVRKSFNYVYLTHYDYVVDDDFTGTAGTADANGIPQYKTVTEAIAAVGTANSSTKVILIRNGEYNEKLVISTPYVSLIGEDSEKTRIYYAVCEGTKNNEADGSRYATTITTGATGFSAENLTFENSWEYLGDGTYQNESAEAVYVEKVDAVFVGVRMLSYQDTLQSKDNNIFLLRCYIAGNVDFMWGQRGTMLYRDCDLVFRYNANKNSGYYTAYGPGAQAIYDGCRFYSEANCGGSKYYLGRPYNGSTAVAFINCYMGSVLNKEWGYTTWGGAELSSDPAQYAAADYVEYGTYGAGYAVNINRRQISSYAVAEILNTDALGWDPYNVTYDVGAKYVGSIVTPVNPGGVSSEYVSNTYSPYEGDDTGLGKYGVEGFAQSTDVIGGGLLKETDENYYKVATGDEFLAALRAIKDKKGVPSVIEITSESIGVGINEIDENHAALYGTGVVAPHNPALVSPVLKESGVSKVYIKQMSNLTIFSKNGATIKHGAFTISDADNVIIRNISFDELWEWDEGDATRVAGDYDVNDWDYMTIENGSNGVWIDHCTFYKAYDGIIDIKTSDAYATPMNITISWCEFLPGSKDNTFFNEMMEYVDANKENMPYYQHLLDEGMTKEQIWWYAYGQKKTHLLGQNDEAAANVNLKVTFANNYYYNSMDRMPRLRFGTAHVYNCIMDAQELLDVRKSITNKDIAKKIVSNGAASTCNGQLLLENCYINGIWNALNSGNGSSPSGYIAAKDTLYYVDGIRYAAVPKVNTTKEGETLKVTDADAFIENLPYCNYNLCDAALLATEVKPYTGAGKMALTTLQWEKGTYYDGTFEGTNPGEDYDNDNADLPEFTVPEEGSGDNGNNNSGNSNAGTATIPSTTDWTVINGQITSSSGTAETNQNVEVVSSGRMEVPVYVIENLKGRNMALILHNGKGAAISIEGAALGSLPAQAVDLTVENAENVIPAADVAQKTEEALKTQQFVVADTGVFQIPVSMHVNVGADYAGKYASLYRYDETEGRLVCVGYYCVTKEGQAMFALPQGGKYLMVVTAQKPADPVEFTGRGRYVVKSGDSMYAIAKMYKMSLRSLILKNPQIKDTNLIRVGDNINLW